MKALIKKQTGILTIPLNFATLESVVDNKFRYKVRYLANPAMAVQQKAFLVKIHVSTQPYVKKVQPVLNTGNSSEIIRNVLRKAPAQKDIVRSAASQYIMTYLSDLSAKIPNNTTKRLTLARFGQNIPIRTNKLLSAKPVSELTEQNVNMPVMDYNLNKETSDVNDQKLKIDSQNLLYIRNTDPANLVNTKSNNFRSAQKAYDGIIGPTVFTQKSNVQRSQQSKNIVSSFVNTTNNSSQVELRSDEFLGVFEEKEQTLIEVEEYVDIPINALSESEFYFVFELVNFKNFPVQTLSNLVPHARNLQLLRIPTLPPTVSVSPINRPGKVAFEITQNDPNARGVNIYRKELKPGQNTVDASYSYVGKIEITAGQTPQRAEDNVSSIHGISYRFIPYTDEGTQSAIFASAIVRFERGTMAKRAKYLRRQSFASLSYDIRGQGITIEIKDVPSAPVALKLLRRNLSGFQKTFDVVGGDVILLDGVSNAPIVVDDTAVKPGRIYEYQVTLIYADGDEETGTNNLVVNYQPIVSNLATTTITEPQIVQQNSSYDVTFSVTYNVLRQNAEIVKKFITEQGLLSEYQSDITDNKELLDRLFAYSVTRTNLTSGEIENYGIIDSLNFSDRIYGIPKNVKPLDPGSEYKYTITTYFRNPETLFPTLTRTVETVTKGSYTFKPYKWRQPITLKDGTLVSQNSLKRNHAQSQFAQGEIADVQTVKVSLANFLPSVQDGQVTQIRDNANLVQWKVNGNLNKIDHFVVILETLGIRTIVGAAHNISNSNYFEFVDTLTNGEKGALTYYVVPVYYDYTRGTELKTNTIVI